MKMSRWLNISLTICVLILQWANFCKQEALDDYILDYQQLNYDPFELHRSHERVKRSIDPHLYLHFKAYDRDFHLKLKTADNIFSPTHKTEDEDGNLVPVDTSFIYSGSLVGEPRSFAHIAIINGTARGHIQVPGDTTYHIEPSKRFFDNPSFHSVIYPEKHMNLDPYKHKREKDLGQCGNDHVQEWMRNVATSAYEVPNRAKRSTKPGSDASTLYKYTEKANRNKRSVKNLALDKKNTCYLYLRSDPTLWNYIKKHKYRKNSNDPELSDDRAREEIQAFFASHVNAIQSIYSGTTFRTYDNSLSYTGVTFLVQRTKIMNDVSERCGTNSATAYCNDKIDVSNFLNLNSLDNHDDFCLAYVFAYRDFTQGTLGLAWVGSPNSAAGGICEKHKMFPQGGITVGKSLNTGIVTIVNYGKTVPSRVSQLTFAHECGHNFGSPHDNGPHCAPYGTNEPDAAKGNYIMFASATMGDKDHNDEFSACSKDNITRVLNAVVEEIGKVNCLAEAQGKFCGNGIVEEGEECDCGYKDDCQDKCCHPRKSPDGECTLTNNRFGYKVQCSPTQGPCCNSSCDYVPLKQHQLCRRRDDCSLDQYCDGGTAVCPPSTFVQNLTACNSYSQVCLSGKCQGSICMKIGWQECFLTSEGDADNKQPSKEELCYVSCYNSETSKCISSFNKEELSNPQNKPFKDLLQQLSGQRQDSVVGIKLPPGSPCDNFRGYCDVFHLCRGVDADGPLARLKNLIFNPKTLQTIKEWIVLHWWAVMLMSIGLVVVMGVFIKVCAVHTPSSNPRKPPARKLSFTLRHRQLPKPQGVQEAVRYGALQKPIMSGSYPV